MQKVLFLTLSFLITALDLQAIDPSFKFEGLFGAPTENICNMNMNVPPFMPYNPLIVEIGAYSGAGTMGLVQQYPYGTIFAFEPHPASYLLLKERIRSFKNVVPINMAVHSANGIFPLWGEGPKASLLPLSKTDADLKIPCTVLDDWCKQNGITHIDFLRLDAEGVEWQILQSSPAILKTVLALVIKTHLAPSKKSIIAYPLVKKLLENQGFELFSHWYQENKDGEATFVRKRLYESIFN